MLTLLDSQRRTKTLNDVLFEKDWAKRLPLLLLFYAILLWLRTILIWIRHATPRHGTVPPFMPPILDLHIRILIVCVNKYQTKALSNVYGRCECCQENVATTIVRANRTNTNIRHWQQKRRTEFDEKFNLESENMVQRQKAAKILRRLFIIHCWYYL